MNLRDTDPLQSVPVQPHPGGFGGHRQSVDLPYLFSILRQHAALIASVSFACVLGMYIFLLGVAPTYEAYSRVILDTRDENVSPVREVVSSLDVSSSVVAGEVVTIQSNVLLGSVVDRLNLLDHPDLDPRRERSEGLIDRLQRTVRGGEPPHVLAQALSPEELRTDVVERMRDNLTVTQLGVSYAINISYASHDPQLAADVANAIADAYIANQLEEKLAISSRANEWLGDRLVELSLQVQEADASVVEFRAQMIQQAEGGEESIAQLLAELNTRLVTSATERADAEVRLAQVEGLLAASGLAAVADVVTSPLLESLQRQRAELEANQALLGSSLGRKHPEMVRISAQIADLDRSIANELQRRVEEMRSEVVVTRNREAALRAQIEKVSERADILARGSVRLSQLERNADATRFVYENFLARYKETSAQADFQTPEARVIGQADVPAVAAAPRKALLIAAAFGVGLSASIAFVFLRNLIRAPVSSSQDLRELTGRPVLAVLPKVRNWGARFNWLRRAIEAPSESHYFEHVNSIRMALSMDGASKKTRTLVVTSSVPNEGKTSLSCALAKSMANGGASVLLVDADLRQPDVRRALDIERTDGCLVDYLEENGKQKDLIIHSDLAGIDVISPARSAKSAADLLSGNMFNGLLTRLSSRYDYIIVNAPPLLYLSDAVLLSKRADETVFAVHCYRTPSMVVRNSIRRLRNAGISITGSVLTMVQRSHVAASENDIYQRGY